MISVLETCQEYLERQLSEGWEILSQDGYNVTLISPDGLIRPLDLRRDIETLRPNAAGDECNIPNEGAGDAACPNHWQNVDEAVPDENTTEVFTNGAGYVRDLYNLPPSSGTGVINSVTVFFRCKESGTGFAKGSMKTGGTAYDGPERNLTSNWVTYSRTWTTNPQTGGGAWTWAQIDALQIGVSLSADAKDDSYCTQVYVEIDYTPAAAAGIEAKSANMGVKMLAGNLI